MELYRHYTLETVCGRGAYSTVYRARNRQTGKLVALKVMKVNDDQERMWAQSEIRILEKVKGMSWAIELLDVAWYDDTVTLTMPFVAWTLHDMIHNGHIATNRCKHVARSIVSAVSSMHACGIIHCDLKPTNILMSLDMKPFITDFGMSCFGTDEAFLRRGYVITRWYRPPELLDIMDIDDDVGDFKAMYGNAVDVWSLGCILCEICMIF